MRRAHTRRGFTLIELLVVGLIIGILAAIAVPQYQKAVMNSKYQKLKALTHQIVKAERVYYMANGKYAYNKDINKLDISFPTESGVTCVAGGYAGLNAIQCTDSNIQMMYWYGIQDNDDKKRRCMSLNFVAGNAGYWGTERTIQQLICQKETGRIQYNGYHYWPIYSYPDKGSI